MLEVINGPAALTAELDRRLRVFDIVIRHMVVRVDEELAVAERARVRRKAAMAARRVRRGLPPEPTETERQRHAGRGRRFGRRHGARCSAEEVTDERHGSRRAGRRRRWPRRAKTRTTRTRAVARGFFRRRRVCKFCVEKIDYINYKDVKLLAPFIPERGKIQPRRISGVCATHQRALQTAIKRARQIALVPYVTD